MTTVNYSQYAGDLAASRNHVGSFAQRILDCLNGHGIVVVLNPEFNAGIFWIE